MTSQRRGRDVNGILLLDKPVGLTSNQALHEAKQLFGAKKAGHTGSLDPLACGMLPICFGEATKFSQFLLEADKEYIVTAKLGVRTKTGDLEGEVIATRDVNVNERQLQKALSVFSGEINQVPSMYSAIKHQGKPLYSYARQGIEIERLSRKVVIKTLELLNFEKDTLQLFVKCTKGTYIRTLVEDMGEFLECGAHVTFLRRTAVAPYHHHKMMTLDALKEQREGNHSLDSNLLPIDTALLNCPEVTLLQSVAYYLKQGQAVMVPKAPTEGWVRIFCDQGLFLGVGQVLGDGRIAPRRLTSQ